MIENVRRLSDRAFASGVNDPNCAAKLRGGPPPPPPPPGNAVGPEGFTLMKDGVARKSDKLYCLTSDASIFYRAVSTLFDFRRP
ncbi:hypothetical protein [Sphingomonas sp. R86521]|uniref:hypothetical protein n=1 Tax=Sphingomonas sp. R86521 TaxID=3093860 RepID=UPI0036D349FA